MKLAGMTVLAFLTSFSMGAANGPKFDDVMNGFRKAQALHERAEQLQKAEQILNASFAAAVGQNPTTAKCGLCSRMLQELQDAGTELTCDFWCNAFGDVVAPDVAAAGAAGTAAAPGIGTVVAGGLQALVHAAVTEGACATVCSQLFNKGLKASFADDNLRNSLCSSVLKMCPRDRCEQITRKNLFDCAGWFPTRSDCDLRTEGQCKWNHKKNRCAFTTTTTTPPILPQGALDGTLGHKGSCAKNKTNTKQGALDHTINRKGTCAKAAEVDPFAVVGPLEQTCLAETPDHPHYQEYSRWSYEMCGVLSNWTSLSDSTSEKWAGDCHFDPHSNQIRCDRKSTCEVAGLLTARFAYTTRHATFDCTGCDPHGTLHGECCRECQAIRNGASCPDCQGKSVLDHMGMLAEDVACLGCAGKYPSSNRVNCKLDSDRKTFSDKNKFSISCKAKNECHNGEVQRAPRVQDTCCEIYPCGRGYSSKDTERTCLDDPQLHAACCAKCLQDVCPFPGRTELPRYCQGCDPRSLRRAQKLMNSHRVAMGRLWEAQESKRGLKLQLVGGLAVAVAGAVLFFIGRAMKTNASQEQELLEELDGIE